MNYCFSTGFEMTSKYASVIDQYIHDGHGSSNTVTFQCTTHVTYNYVVNCLEKKEKIKLVPVQVLLQSIIVHSSTLHNVYS